METLHKIVITIPPSHTKFILTIQQYHPDMRDWIVYLVREYTASRIQTNIDHWVRTLLPVKVNESTIGISNVFTHTEPFFTESMIAELKKEFEKDDLPFTVEILEE
jgi:hypothetical protein